MKNSENYQNLANNLRAIIGILELDRTSPLYRDGIAICQYLENPIFRIAVFGPFNYGKSTLLNAILGQRTLPIDLIPTTGAAIHVRYGRELQTRITLTNSREITENGTDILKQFAILDDNRRMRDDVAKVEVFCPHPFLQTGVELLDLPGTDDREAQDALVREQLLTADLVIQVLDARKLMTLGEREHLRDWLMDRGIKTVVFVANFLNLLEPDEQKQVYNRLLFVAESFRSELPNNISNLYRVDALPALRARLKGDTAAAQITGLGIFESALQSIVAAKQEKTAIQFPRVEAIAISIQQAGETKAQAISAEITAAEAKDKAKLEIKQKAQKLIQKGFSASVSDFQGWLYLPKLIERYQSELASALQNGTFAIWEEEIFKIAIAEYQEDIIKWVNQASEFFDCHQPPELTIPFPNPPEIILPPPPLQPNTSKESGNVTPLAIATGLGWMLAGVVGAAVVGGATYLFGKGSNESEVPKSSVSYLDLVVQAYREAAKDYLTHFTTEAFAVLQEYEQIAETIINCHVKEEALKITTQHHQLQLLQTLLHNLSEDLSM
ncbi:dynamin family protein [Limnofasciculus baicalensis]|uniref:Dynamin family protein n=1 Tax=Limnofasciculus baicalensis BBK-W-15 TaxID=2699891 RepID=A0AAE3GR89_9CYAN|nr:dynamin family protein [Limnofasciculus baicalensis]MCP2728388.1 dynamin family protein [Limnofasciculus baicalensis BBK-W-15]